MKGRFKEYLENRKEGKAKFEEEIKKTRPGKGFFLNYPTDRFFWQPTFQFLTIPKGYVGVRERWGSIGDILEHVEDPNGFETLEDGTKITATARDFHWGGIVKPGFRFMLSAYGGWSRMAVVNMGEQKMDLQEANLITRDGIEIEKVDAFATYRVVDPVRAMTLGGERKYRGLVKELSQARMASVIGNSTFSKIQRDAKGVNLAVNPDQTRYSPEELRHIGVKINGIYVTKIDIPNELRDELGAVAIATAKGKARVIYAQADNAAAQEHAAAGAVYDGSPGARAVYNGTISREQKSGFVNIAGLENVASTIAEALRPRQP